MKFDIKVCNWIAADLLFLIVFKLLKIEDYEDYDYWIVRRPLDICLPKF